MKLLQPNNIVRLAGALTVAGLLLSPMMLRSQGSEFFLWIAVAVVFGAYCILTSREVSKGSNSGKLMQIIINVPIVVLIFIAPPWYLFLVAAIASVIATLVVLGISPRGRKAT